MKHLNESIHGDGTDTPSLSSVVFVFLGGFLTLITTAPLVCSRVNEPTVIGDILIVWVLLLPVVLGILIQFSDWLIARTFRTVTRGEVENRRFFAKYFAPKSRRRFQVAWPRGPEAGSKRWDGTPWLHARRAYPVTGLLALMIWVPWILGVWTYSLFLEIGMPVVWTSLAICGIFVLYHSLVFIARMAWDVSRTFKTHESDPDAHKKS